MFLILVMLVADFCFAETLVETSAKTEFVIGVERIDYIPFYGFNDEEYIGYAREFFDAFAKEKGYVLRYKILPVKRLYLEFLDGTIDCKFPDSPFWQQDSKKDITIHYSDSIADFIDGLMVCSENQSCPVASLTVIGTVRGFTAWDYLDLINSGTLGLSENNSLHGLLQQVIMNRIDGAYVNVAVADRVLKESGTDSAELVFAENLPHTKGSYLCSSIKYPNLIAELNRFLEEKKDLIDALRSKHQVKMFSQPQQLKDSAQPECDMPRAGD